MHNLGVTFIKSKLHACEWISIFWFNF
jgi:hypothetical protein